MDGKTYKKSDTRLLADMIEGLVDAVMELASEVRDLREVLEKREDDEELAHHIDA